MVFTAPVFLFLFLPLTLALYFLRPSIQYRNFILLVLSLFFYAWGEGKFFLVMVASVALNYFLGLKINDSKVAISKRNWLIFAIAVNLGILAYCKYAVFFIENLNTLLSQLDIQTLEKPKIHLPAGVSFFTFHALSYLIDIYRGHFRAQRNPVNLGLYIALFPQLLAGPIVRYEFIGSEIENRKTSLSDFCCGIKRFVLGLAKKVLIADNIAVISDQIFTMPAGELTTSIAWLGAITYTLQIYFDFSGYSDMAIGMARMFGFKFPENFNYPYLATSITDFWRRWHISLSSWFRDYLYIPLGGNRVSKGRQYFNLFTVFFLCGLWHGANWTFVVWGMFHGTLLVLEKRFLLSTMKAVPKPIQHALNLLLVVFSWVIFRSESLDQAGTFFSKMIYLPGLNLLELYAENFLDSFSTSVIATGVLLSMPIGKYIFFEWGEKSDLRWSATAIMTLVLMVMSYLHIASSTFSPFIYYRF